MLRIRDVAALLLSVATAFSQCVSLTAPNGAVAENFNTLASTGTSSTLPTGWAFLETGSNANLLYNTGTGSNNAGDTYSFGPANNTERAFGMLLSGSLTPVIGACFTNNTGVTVTSVAIQYAGEQWRYGATGRVDRLDFQYSTTASAVNSTGFTDFNALDFNAPASPASAGALDGNASANRTAISGTITGLSIAPGATLWIRWSDFNAAGSDDGLAVDDFSLTPNPAGAPLPQISINDVSQAEGNSGQTVFRFTVSLNSPAPAGGVSFTIGTADGTATSASGDYVAQSSSVQTIAEGNQTLSFDVPVGGDSLPEPNEVFFADISAPSGATIADGRGQGTILNDDVVLTPISSIQGTSTASPLANSSVSTSGIVTGRTSNGFFLQTPDASVDADQATSEGIFIFTSTAPPAAAAVGNLVQVTGTVFEFGTAPLTLTEITGPAVVQISTGNPLPTPVVINSTVLNPGGGRFQMERFEGMRVSIGSLTVTQPTDGTPNAAAATSTTNGEFYGVVTGTPLPFREAGIESPLPVPTCAAGSGCSIPVWDANPEVLRVKSNGLTGQPAIDVPALATVSNINAIVDSFQGKYSILPDGTTTPAVAGGFVSAVAVPLAGSNEITVASYNLERLFDDVNDPATDDPVLSVSALGNRLGKASLGIRNVLRSPDVLAIQEAENVTVLQALASRINADAIAAGQPDPGYTAHLLEGVDPGGIDVGFLLRNTVSATPTQAPVGTFVNPQNGASEQLNDRPPLILVATVSKNGRQLPLTVIVNHLRSLNGIDDDTPVEASTVGGRVRAKRKAQAEFLANLIQARLTSNPAENIAVVGDFNAFDVNDGYAAVLQTVVGTPVAGTQVQFASADLLNPDLQIGSSLVPASENYSYRFEGNAQTIDHILMTPGVFARAVRYTNARLNANFPESLRGDFSRPERMSDHDPAIVYLTTATPLASGFTVARSGFTYNAATQISSGTVRITNTGANTIQGPIQFVVHKPVAGISLANSTGENAQGRFITSPGSLAPGQSVTIPVQFLNPGRVLVNYTPKVYSGAF